MSISKVVAASYLAASKYKLKDVATFIRKVVLKAFKSSKEMLWPPTIDDIEKMSTEKLPEKLERFLNLVFFVFFFYLGFLSRTFTILSRTFTAGEVGGHLFNSSLPLPPASQTLRH